MFLTDEQLRFWRVVQSQRVTHVPAVLGRPNLGDDIQTLAAMRFCGVSQWVERDRIHAWPKDARVLLCGWYDNAFIPSEEVSIIVAGFHLCERQISSFKREGMFERLATRVKYQGFPAGCRDSRTVEILHANGISAIFSGCVTQTLPSEVLRCEEKLAVDVRPPDNTWVFLSHGQSYLKELTVPERLIAAEAAMLRLSRASKLLTCRLHAYLPAKAFGVPEVRLRFEQPIPDPSRWSGHILAQELKVVWNNSPTRAPVSCGASETQVPCSQSAYISLKNLTSSAALCSYSKHGGAIPPGSGKSEASPHSEGEGNTAQFMKSMKAPRFLAKAALESPKLVNEGVGPGVNYGETVPFFYTRSGCQLSLEGCYRGAPAFLIANGPSLMEMDLAPLHSRWCMTMNNGTRTFRGNANCIVDDPAHFSLSMWLDPTIMKFMPMAFFEKPLWDNRRLQSDRGWKQEWAPSKVRAGDCPSVVGYRRNEEFNAPRWLWEDTINWGNDEKHGGGRSVMLAALRILFLLGFRQVYLLGVDFNMSPDHRYHFPEQRSHSSIQGNMSTYAKLQQRFTELQPHFLKAGFKVWNCNAESRLTAFPHLPYAEALAASGAVLGDFAHERTEGMYQKIELKPQAANPASIATPPAPSREAWYSPLQIRVMSERKNSAASRTGRDSPLDKARVRLVSGLLSQQNGLPAKPSPVRRRPADEVAAMLARGGRDYSIGHQRMYLGPCQLLSDSRSRVLEVGFGIGWGLKKLAACNVFREYVGYEADRNCCEFVRQFVLSDLGLKDGAKVRLEHADWGRLACPGDIPVGFGNVFCIEVIEHVDPAAIHDFLKRLRLACSGRLWLSTPDRNRSGHGLYSPGEVRNLLGRAGFRDIACVPEQWTNLYLAG
jgi:hypothetical protein